LTFENRLGVAAGTGVVRWTIGVDSGVADEAAGKGVGAAVSVVGGVGVTVIDEPVAAQPAIAPTMRTMAPTNDNRVIRFCVLENELGGPVR
jgi:hypothetical protein